SWPSCCCSVLTAADGGTAGVVGWAGLADGADGCAGLADGWAGLAGWDAVARGAGAGWLPPVRPEMASTIRAAAATAPMTTAAMRYQEGPSRCGRRAAGWLVAGWSWV